MLRVRSSSLWKTGELQTYLNSLSENAIFKTGNRNHMGGGSGVRLSAAAEVDIANPDRNTLIMPRRGPKTINEIIKTIMQSKVCRGGRCRCTRAPRECRA